jgi:hypothetical protein
MEAWRSGGGRPVGALQPQGRVGMEIWSSGGTLGVAT